MPETALILAAPPASGPAGISGELLGLSFLERAVHTAAECGARSVYILVAGGKAGLPPSWRRGSQMGAIAPVLIDPADKESWGSLAPSLEGPVLIVDERTVFSPALVKEASRAGIGGSECSVFRGVDGQATGIGLCPARRVSDAITSWMASTAGMLWDDGLAGAVTVPVAGGFALPVLTAQNHAAARRALLSSVRKESDDFVARTFNRPLSLLMTRLFIPLGLTPNIISITGLLIGIVGALFAAAGTAASVALGGLLFQLSSVLDGSDGEVARLTFNCSDRGSWFDTLCDELTVVAFFTGLPLGMYHRTGDPVYIGLLVLTFLSAGCLYLLMIRYMRRRRSNGNMMKLLDDMKETARDPGILNRVTSLFTSLHFFTRRPFFSFLIFILCLLGMNKAIVWGVAFSVVVIVAYFYAFSTMMLQKDQRPPQEDLSPAGRGVASKASAVVFSETFANIARVVALVILVRYLPKETVGSLLFVLLTYVALSSLAQIGLPESIYFFFEKVDRSSRGRFILVVARLLLVLAVATSGLLFVIGLVADARGHDVMPLFMALLLLPVLELPTMPVPHVLIATDRAKKGAWINVLFSVVLFTAMVGPPLAGLPVVYVPKALLLYGALRLAVGVIVFVQHFRGEMGPLPRGMTRELLNYSIPLGVAQMIWKLNQVVDKYVVMYFLPMAVFAEYTVGSWEIPFVPSISVAVGAVMMPLFVAAYLDGRKKDLLLSWTEALKKVSIIVLPLMVLLIIIAREFIVVLFTDKYLNAVLPFQIYTLILFQRVTAYDAILKAIDRTRTVTVWALGTILINLALSIPLVMKMGMIGAALSTLIANVIMWFFILVKISEGLEVSMARVFPYRFYGRTLAVAVLAGLPAVFLPQLVQAGAPVILGAKVGVYVICFVLLGALAGVLGREEWVFVTSAGGRS